MRRAWALVAVASLVVSACSASATPVPTAKPAAPTAAPSTSAASPTPAPPSGPPIKLGMVDTLSGANAQIGTDSQQGAQIAVDQVNKAGGVLGRPLEIVAKDEAPDSAAAVSAVRSLNSDGIPFVFGFTSSADALAVVPIAKQINSIIVGSHAATTSLTTTQWVKNFIRISASDAMSTKAISAYTNKKFPGLTTWNVLGYDYVTGHDQWDTFVKNMTSLTGGKFTKGKEAFFPFAAVTSLTPYITSVVSSLPADSAQTQGLFLATFGAGTFNLVKQGQPYDLFKKFKAVMAVAGGGFLHQADQLGKDTPDIYSQYDYYYQAYDTPENKAFVADYQARYKEVPGSWALHGYLSILAYQAAIAKAGSTDFAKVLAAFDDLEFASPQGIVTIRSTDHQASVNVVMRHFQPDPTSPKGYKVSEVEVTKAVDILPAVVH